MDYETIGKLIFSQQRLHAELECFRACGALLSAALARCLHASGTLKGAPC